MNLLQAFADQLVSTLDRASLNKASLWAERYRRSKDNKPWSLKGYPWTKEWHDADVELGCILKAAQLAATETMISKCMFANDVLRQDVLYVLPDWRPTASDFSATRFDLAVKASPYLDALYVERNVGLKRTSAAVTYIRGAHGRSGLKSVPAPWLFLDELDEMEQGMVALAYERTSGQRQKHVWELSTPSIEDHGIDRSWKSSSQEHFCFPCPLCGRWTNLRIQNPDDPECLEVVGDDPTSERTLKESYLKCAECGGKLDHLTKLEWLKNGRWIPSVHGRVKRGFYINQLYSTTVTPGEVAAAFLRGKLSAPDEQEFWNSKMGLPHTPRGARLTIPEVEACKREHVNGSPSRDGTVVTMGIDVGKKIHYEIDEWMLGNHSGNDVNANAACRVIKAGFVRTFDELDTLMLEHRPDYCVIDAHPERRLAAQFANRFWGRVSMCIYGNGVSGKQLHEHVSDDREPLVTCDRTSWLDLSVGRFRTQTISLPRDVSFEYVSHLTSIARIWEHDQHNNPIGRWVAPGGLGDHHAHSRNYAEIALALSTNLRQSYDLEVE